MVSAAGSIRSIDWCRKVKFATHTLHHLLEHVPETKLVSNKVHSDETTQTRFLNFQILH